MPHDEPGTSAEPPAAPVLDLAWADREILPGAGVVLSRPDPLFAPAAFRLAADPALWVDVPSAWRPASVAAQRDVLERAMAHWDQQGFGYWLVWGQRGDDPGDGVGGELLGLGGLRWMWWRQAWVLNVYVRLAVRAQGRGVARRLLALAIDRLDAAVPGPATVVVRTRPANEAMAGLAHRLGFDEAGTEEREAGTYRVLVRQVGRPGDSPRAGDQAGPRTVRLRDRGPMVLPGGLPVRRVDARSGAGPGPWRTRGLEVPDDDRGNVALCRCGHSADRPFCDGTHRGRRDRLAVDAATAPPAAASVDRPSGLGPTVVVEDDGPIRVCGGIRVLLPDGTTVVPPDGTGLCRCGASARRPWCDGSHVACAFTEPARPGGGHGEEPPR